MFLAQMFLLNYIHRILTDLSRNFAYIKHSIASLLQAMQSLSKKTSSKVEMTDQDRLEELITAKFHLHHYFNEVIPME